MGLFIEERKGTGDGEREQQFFFDGNEDDDSMKKYVIEDRACVKNKKVFSWNSR